MRFVDYILNVLPKFRRPSPQPTRTFEDYLTEPAMRTDSRNVTDFDVLEECFGIRADLQPKRPAAAHRKIRKSA
jgi:hypothetical protein